MVVQHLIEDFGEVLAMPKAKLVFVENQKV